jgi:hypothetical protein
MSKYVCRLTSVHKILCLSISHPHHTLVSYIKVLAHRSNEILQALPVRGSLFYPSIYRYQVRLSLFRRRNIHIIYKNLLHTLASAIKVILTCLTKNLSWLSQQRQTVRHTGRLIMFSVITNIYNKKAKEPNLMELFTATGKLKKSVWQIEMFDVYTTGDTAHIDTILKFLPHTRQHGCINILHCCNYPSQ